MHKIKKYVVSLLGTNWYKIVFSAVIILSLLVRLKNLNSPLLDTHYFRQTQTATIARNYYRHGINLLHPTLDIFGDGKGKVLVLEFPFFQAIVASAAYIIGFSDSLGRVIAVFFGLSGGFVLMLLVNELTKNKYIGLFSLILYLFMPLNIFFQQAFMIESTVVALHIFSLYCWFKYSVHQDNFWFFLAIIFTTLAFLQKSVYAPFLIPPILAIYYLYKGKSNPNNPKFLVGLFIPIIILFLWQDYADITNTANGNTYFTSSNSDQLLWNLGTISDRLTLASWVYRLKNLIDSITKINLVLFPLGLLVIVFSQKKEKPLLLLWCISMLAYFAIFFRIQSHNYYSLIILPIISIIAAYGLFYIYNLLVGSKRLLLIFITIFFSIYIFKGWRNSLPYFWIDQNTQNELIFLKKAMKGSGNVVFVRDQKDWNSVYTYYTDRTGIVLTPSELTPAKIIEFQDNNYRYFVLDNITSDSMVEALREVRKSFTLIGSYKNIKVYRL